MRPIEVYNPPWVSTDYKFVMDEAKPNYDSTSATTMKTPERVSLSLQDLINKENATARIEQCADELLVELIGNPIDAWRSYHQYNVGDKVTALSRGGFKQMLVCAVAGISDRRVPNFGFQQISDKRQPFIVDGDAEWQVLRTYNFIENYPESFGNGK